MGQALVFKEEEQNREEAAKLGEDIFGNDLVPQYKEWDDINLPTMKIALVREGALFKKANEYAAGYDLKAFDIKLEDGYIKFMLGVKHELPKGYYFEVVHKSSNSKFQSILANTKGTIDCDFPGEWQARIKIIPQPEYISLDKDNMLQFQIKLTTQYLQLWQEGEIALQAILHKEPEHQIQFVSEDQIIPKSDRDTIGHGSTGNGLSK